MAHNRKSVTVNITTGPDLMELLTSFTRSNLGPYDIDMDKAKSVLFSTDGWAAGVPKDVRANIDSMERESGSGRTWNITGELIDLPDITGFKGFYDCRKGVGQFTLTRK